MGAYEASQSGWYAQGTCQFMPRWRFGVRHDRLRSPDPGPSFAGTALHPGVLGPPLLAGLLVVATHVPLGREVLSRGIIFLDLAVAQIAGLGAIAATTLGWTMGGWGTQLARILRQGGGGRDRPPVDRAPLAGNTGGADRRGLRAGGHGGLLLAGHPHGAERLENLLAGQILWIRYGQLAPVAVLTGLVLAFWFVHGRGTRRGFYGLFALAVAASVQLVGVYLVFASLIITALAVRSLSGGPALAPGYALGAAGYGLGLTASALFDLPAGPVVVWMLALLGGTAGRVVSRARA